MKNISIEIEWAPRPKEVFLADHTSFDAYVSYETTSHERGALGIEVKYTEEEYDWGRTERPRMFNEGSRYNQVHRESALYVEEARESLRTKRLKQLWRNQLLGEAMLQQGAQGLTRFTSVLLYPAGNRHFHEVVAEYREMLRPEHRDVRFIGVTFESFISALRRQVQPGEALGWIKYLQRRYIVRN